MTAISVYAHFSSALSVFFFSAPQFWFLFLTPLIYWTLYCFCKCKWYASYPILFVWLARTLWNIISNHKILFRLQRNRRVDAAYSLVDRKCHTEYHLLLSFSFWTATMMYSKINTILPSWFCCVKRSAVLLSQLGLLTHMECDYSYILWALTCYFFGLSSLIENRFDNTVCTPRIKPVCAQKKA